MLLILFGELVKLIQKEDRLIEKITLIDSVNLLLRIDQEYGFNVSKQWYYLEALVGIKVNILTYKIFRKCFN